MIYSKLSCLTGASQVALVIKNPLASVRDTIDAGWIPGLGKSPGGRKGTPILYSCLENPMDKRSLVGYSSWGRKESDTTEGHAPC